MSTGGIICRARRPEVKRAGGGDVSVDDSIVREILSRVRRIAVVGIKDDPAADAFRIPRYMQAQGYRIIPVNPKLDGVLGEPGFASLGEVDAAIDLVNLFRAPDHIPAHVEEILDLSPRPLAVWMQLGIHHSHAAGALRAAGVQVVQDRCILVDHRRLIGSDESGRPVDRDGNRNREHET